MVNVSKIQDEDEVKRWFAIGWTYQRMGEEHRRKYGVAVPPSTLSDFRRRHHLPRRNVRNVELLPWAVLDYHRQAYEAAMLRAYARRLAGHVQDDDIEQRIDAFLRRLTTENKVVDYNPEVGFALVDRRADEPEGTLVRQPPEEFRTKRPPQDS